MDEVSKSELKAKMFEYFRNIERTGRPLLVKDYGEPVLVVQRFARKRKLSDVFEPFRNKVKINRAELLKSESEEWVEDDK